jgi:hypothetical protein
LTPRRSAGGGLDDLARVHDRDPVRELEQQREVVRDEDHGEPKSRFSASICWRISRWTTTSSASSARP